MRRPRSWTSLLASNCFALGVVAAWIALAPAQLGGQLSYVAVVGNSMRPALHAGDLAVVRRTDEHQPGDIVAFRHPDIGPIIHRIVSTERDRLVLKGDNNAWLDSYQPLPSELIGRLWLRAPHVGAWMEGIRGTWGAPVVGGIAVAIGAFTYVRRGPPRRGRLGRRGTQGGTPMNLLSENGREMLGALGTAALASVLLLAYSSAQPMERTVSQDVKYEHTGVFSYGAEAPVDRLYDHNKVSTGEPVYRRLTDHVWVTFAYKLVATSHREINGTHRLTAVVSDTTGWKRTIELKPETEVRGDVATTEAVLDLQYLQELIDHLEAETGVKREHYAVAIVPEVVTRGTLAGREFQERFAPRLGFRLDRLQLQMLPAGPKEPDPLTPAQAGTVQISRTEPNALTFLSFAVDVADARRLSSIGLALSLAGVIVLLVLTLRMLHGGEPTRIASRFGPLLVSVGAGAAETPPRVIGVATIEDLAKLAERTNSMILHQASGTVHHYLVQDRDVTYHYQAVGGRPEAAESAIEVGG